MCGMRLVGERANKQRTSSIRCPIKDISLEMVFRALSVIKEVRKGAWLVIV